MRFDVLASLAWAWHRWGEIWHGGGDRGPSSVTNFIPSVQRVATVGRKTSKSAYE